MHTLKIILALSFYVVCVHMQQITELNESIRKFSNNFFQKVVDNNKNKNLVISPLSAYISLSMTAYGSAGKTAKQLRDALYLPSNDASTRQNFPYILNYLDNVRNLNFKFANAMCIDKRFRLKNTYKELTSQSFFNDPFIIDTRQAHLSATHLNEWVMSRTERKIRALLHPDEIPLDSRLLLASSLFFKGKWAKAFEKRATRNRQFYFSSTAGAQVPTMFTAGNYFSGELPDLKAEFVELPYQNNEWKMVVIVPDEVEGLNNIVQNLDSFNRSRLDSAGCVQDLHVYLPSFNIESVVDLKLPLQQLHITDMFDGNANLAGISSDAIRVDKIIQKALIDASEDGVEGSSIVPTKRKFSPIKPKTVSNSMSNLKLGVVVVDRPFLFQVIDNRLGMAVFVGIVTDPNQL